MLSFQDEILSFKKLTTCLEKKINIIETKTIIMVCNYIPNCVVQTSDTTLFQRRGGLIQTDLTGKNHL